MAKRVVAVTVFVCKVGSLFWDCTIQTGAAAAPHRQVAPAVPRLRCVFYLGWTKLTRSSTSSSIWGRLCYVIRFVVTFDSPFDTSLAGWLALGGWCCGRWQSVGVGGRDYLVEMWRTKIRKGLRVACHSVYSSQCMSEWVLTLQEGPRRQFNKYARGSLELLALTINISTYDFMGENLILAIMFTRTTTRGKRVHLVVIHHFD